MKLAMRYSTSRSTKMSMSGGRSSTRSSRRVTRSAKMKMCRAMWARDGSRYIVMKDGKGGGVLPATGYEYEERLQRVFLAEAVSGNSVIELSEHQSADIGVRCLWQWLAVCILYLGRVAERTRI